MGQTLEERFLGRDGVVFGCAVLLLCTCCVVYMLYCVVIVLWHVFIVFYYAYMYVLCCTLCVCVHVVKGLVLRNPGGCGLGQDL